jgi:hypothetical protein
MRFQASSLLLPLLAASSCTAVAPVRPAEVGGHGQSDGRKLLSEEIECPPDQISVGPVPCSIIDGAPDCTPTPEPTWEGGRLYGWVFLTGCERELILFCGNLCGGDYACLGSPPECGHLQQ